MTGRMLAIGDIHGCNRRLQQLLDRIEFDPHADTLVFVGDYLDRGPDVRGIIDTLLDLKETYPNMICLRGNHESMFLNYYQEGRDEELFLYNGGMSTLDSYGLTIAEARRGTGFPESHLRFLSSLPLFYETEATSSSTRASGRASPLPNSRRKTCSGSATSSSIRTGISAASSSSATPPFPNPSSRRTRSASTRGRSTAAA